MSENITEPRVIHVAKFGGTSLADAAQFRRVRHIVDTFGEHCCIVPSAPGKRFPCDTKITDMLYCMEHAWRTQNEHDAMQILLSVKERFADIAVSLDISAEQFDIDALIEEIHAELERGEQITDYFASRGEYLCGRLLAAYLGFDFIDAAAVVFFDEGGNVLMPRTLRAIAKRMRNTNCAVIPGFYGTDVIADRVKSFSRGGSDVTGAIVARAVCAEEYENWTDVSGFYAADPRIVKNAKRVESLNFSELRELSCMGAGVLHASTVLPLMDTNIPIRVRNTNDLRSKGTLITPKSCGEARTKIAGIAGKRGYTTVNITKLSLGADSSFARRTLHVFEACSVPVEHMPLSMDNLSIVTFTRDLDEKRDMLVKELRAVLGDISVEFFDGLALIAAVSTELNSNADFAKVMFEALCDKGINVRLTDQGSGSNSFVIGVDDDVFDDAVRAVYAGFEAHKYL